VPGFVYVDGELVQRISEGVLRESWDCLWKEVNERLGTSFADAEGEELSGVLLTQFVDMVEAYVQGPSGGETRDALTELVDICRRQAEVGATVWIET